jgi:hypothetical protein
MSTSQDRANVSLSHFWLAKRCHPNNHAKRRETFNRLMDDPSYEQELRRVSEAISGDD